MSRIGLIDVDGERWLSREPLPDEEWRPVPGYEGLYEVSNYGRFLSIGREYVNSNGIRHCLKTKLIKPYKHNSGYLAVCFRKDGKSIRFLAHRVVAFVFIPNPNNLPQINHIDENKKNNKSDNLEWCSAIYNLEYGTRRQREKETKSKPINCYTKDGVFVKTYSSITNAALHLTQSKKSCGNISACARGLTRSSYGYVWRFVDNGKNRFIGYR